MCGATQLYYCLLSERDYIQNSMPFVQIYPTNKKMRKRRKKREIHMERQIYVERVSEKEKGVVRGREWGREIEKEILRDIALETRREKEKGLATSLSLQLMNIFLSI